MTHAADKLPFWISEIDDAAPATDLFRRKFGHPPPDIPHHVAGFHCAADGSLALACYVHFWSFGDILLGGGACVDDRVLRRLSPRERADLRRAGGLYRIVLDHALRRFSPHYAAIFGYCGDRRAEAVDLAAGFVPTGHDRLLVYWPRQPHANHEQALIAKAHALGAF